MHCLYNQKESAFELSAAAVEKCCELINDILEYQHNESKPKSLYFSINGILYIFEIDKHQISLIKKYYKDKKVDLSKVGIPTKVSVKPTESDNLKPGIPAVLCLEIPKDYQIEGSNCALNKQNGNHIIIVGSGKSDIFVLLTLQDEKEILPLSEPFYLLVNNGFYLINKVDNKILESIKPSNNEEVKQTTNNPIPENDQEILKP